MGIFKTGGGGFLNGVTGTIAGYKFDSKVWPPKKKGGDDYTTISMELNILQDGVDVPVQQFLQGGFLHDGETISADGQTIEADHDGAVILENSEVGKFINSLIEGGFDAALLPNDRNFAPIIGARVVFKKIVDKDATAQFGQRVAKKGKSKGKGFDRDYLAVESYIETVKVKAGKAAAGKAKAAPKATAAKAAPAAAAEDATDAEIDGNAVGVLLSLLADAKKPVKVGMLNSIFMPYALKNNIGGDEREALRRTVTSPEFLATEGMGWTLKDGVLAIG